MKILILFFNLLAIAWGLEVALNPAPPYPVLRFKFEVNPKVTNDLLGYLLESKEYEPAFKTMKASTLLANTNIHELTLDQWNNVEAGSKLNFTRIDVDKLQEISSTLKIKTSQEFTRLMNMLNDPMAQMKAALNAINVNEMQIMYYTMMNSEGNETFFDFFKDANFSNMAEAQKHLGLSNEQFFDFEKSVALKYLNNTNLQEFARLLNNITGEINDFNVGYEKEQVGLIKNLFKELEVYPDVEFTELISSYNKSIISPLILATRVKTGGYLSSGAIYSEFQRMSLLYTKPFLVEGPNHQRYDVKSASFKGSLSEFQTTDNITFLPKEGLVSQLQRCLYAPNENQTFLVSATEANHEMTITKGTNVFVIGAPLFCDQQLVGVALGETESNIIFAKVPFKMAPIPVPTQGPASVKPIDKPHQPPYPPVINVDLIATLDFHVIPSKIPNLVAYLLMDTVNGNQSQTTTADVIPGDVLEAFKLSNLAYADFIRFIPKNNLQTVDYNKTMEFLKIYNISMISMVNNFMNKLSTPEKLDVVKALNVSFFDVQNLYLFHNNNELKYREFFDNANLTKANIDSAMKATNFTNDKIFDIMKSAILESLQNSSMDNVLQVMQSLGGYSSLDKHIQKQTITPEGFLTSSSMTNIVQNFDIVLSNSSAVAPIISRRNVLTATEVYDHYNDPTTREFVSLNVTTHNQHLGVEKMTVYHSGYANITLSSPLLVETWLPIANAADTEPKLCRMITDRGVYDVARVARLRDGYEVILDDVVTRDTYKLGAGLVCQGRLHGVASKLVTSGAPERIQFAGVREGVKPVSSDKPSSGYQMSSSIIVMICAVFGILYVL